MKAKIISGIFIIFLSINSLQGQSNPPPRGGGQTIKYTYDENGSRKSRVLTVEPLGSKGLNFPVEKVEKLPVIAQKEELIKTEGELSTSVYPNPNKGLIKIDILFMPLNSKTEARIYDLSGIEQLVKRNFESSSEINISHLKDGIYILRIKVNESLFDWKIVKSQ